MPPRIPPGYPPGYPQQIPPSLVQGLISGRLFMMIQVLCPGCRLWSGVPASDPGSLGPGPPLSRALWYRGDQRVLLLRAPEVAVGRQAVDGY